MTTLEKRLEEAYNDLEAVDRLYDNLTQENKQEIDYCIRKRLFVCDRIKAIKKEIALDKQYAKVERPKEIKVVDWNEFILSCVGIKKESPVAKPNDSL